MTRLLDFPLELLDIIMHYAMISRGVARALRLKTVCKAFSYSVDRTLFHTKLLDDKESNEPLGRWEFHRHHCAAHKLWHDYLVFRCRDKRDESVACYVGIRETVDALVRHINCQDDSECRNDNVHAPGWDEVLDRLCWLAAGCDQTGNCMLYYGARWHAPAWWGSPGEWREWREWRERQYSPDGLIQTGLMILPAATYLGYTSLVRQLLNQGHDPTKCDDVFPSPMYIAAWTGRTDMLLLLREHLPDFEECKHINDGMDNGISYTWRFEFGPGSLHGAACRGDMDMVRLCMARDGEDQDKAGAEMLIFGHKPGTIPHDSKLGTYIERAMHRTRSPKVYDYLLSLLDNANPSSGTSHTLLITRHLAVMSGAGDITMVRHLLRLGADPSSKDSSSPKPLIQAISTRNHSIVDLLLSRGADPNGREKLSNSFTSRSSFNAPLLAAVKTGNIKMVQRVLDAGAKVQFPDDDERALRYAVQMEHTAMVELLLDTGVVSTDIGKACALWRAEKMGLESMAELLRSRGAKLTPWVSPPTPWVPPRGQIGPKSLEEWREMARQHAGKWAWTPPERMLSLPLSRLRY